jgi:hypothetical protein
MPTPHPDENLVAQARANKSASDSTKLAFDGFVQQVSDLTRQVSDLTQQLQDAVAYARGPRSHGEGAGAARGGGKGDALAETGDTG